MKNYTHNINFIQKIIQKDIKKNKSIKIKTRFPPDPNGYLHLGHAKSLCLNFDIANQYHGKCNLRFDDTNPNKNHTMYIESIKKDILWLGFRWYGSVKYTSMYFDQIYQYAIELIEKNLAYVDQLTSDEIRLYRGTLTKPGKNSPYRNQTIKENISLFEKMKLGHFQEKTACLRAKINMQSPLIVMRDPVLYRIKFSEHHFTKDKWCIYPTYDFSHCISDAIEKITHSLCTLEFQDNRILYEWILKNINISHSTKQYEYSRLNLEYSTLSKRKLQLLIDNKIIKRWDDPRMPTISGLRKRGYTPSSIKNFCKNIGITKQNNLIEISSLESCIRKELNNTAYRTMAILDPITVIITNIPESYEEKISILNHPHNINMKSREISFTNEIYIERSDFQEFPENNYKRFFLGGSIKLKYSYIITSESIKKNQHNQITHIFCNADFKKSKKIKKYNIIHWISKKDAIKSEFRLYDNIFNTKNMNNQENILMHINKYSKIIKDGFVHISIKEDSTINTYQFERIGYFIMDTEKSNDTKPIFHRIVTLREKWK